MTKRVARSLTILISCLLLGSIGVLAMTSEYTVWQKQKNFSQTELKIKVGDTISFPNGDPFFHNLYSLSSTKIFDLGSYKQGETRRVTFDKPGIVEVRCAIHPSMKLKVEVQE